MLSNKNHITRQKNVELIGISDDSLPSFVISSHHNSEDNDSSSSIGKSKQNISYSNSNSNSVNLEEKSQHEEEKSNFESKPEQKNSANLSENSVGCFDDDKITLDLFTALNEIQPTKEIVANPIIKASKTVQSNSISTHLRQKLLRSKSPMPSNSKKLLSTHSNPAVPVKINSQYQSIEASQNSSFFSRSCPGESLLENCDDNLSKIKTNIKTNSLKQELPSQSLKSIGRSFLAFATLKNNKNKKYSDSNGSSGSFNNTSNWSSLNTETNDEYTNDFQGSLPLSSSNNKTAKIGSYEVDLEKFAREMSQPTMNTPLTSFSLLQADNHYLSPSSNKTNKPMLLSSKTIDQEPSSTKKTITRSFTQKQ